MSMTADRYVSSNNSSESHLNAKSSNTKTVVQSTVFCFSVYFKGDASV